ncbi:hypothetical protein ABPG74_015084 [Tetrahymena malaccensis]
MTMNCIDCSSLASSNCVYINQNICTTYALYNGSCIDCSTVENNACKYSNVLACSQYGYDGSTLLPLIVLNGVLQIQILDSHFIMNGLPLDILDMQSIEQTQVTINNTIFSHISSRLYNGGCLSFQNQMPQLILEDVIFDSCISFYFAGAIYGGTLRQVSNVTQKNCQSMIAGGSFFSSKTDLATQEKINYVDNSALFQADYLQLGELKIENILEYNPQFIGTDLFLQKTNYQNPKEFVSLRIGFFYVIKFLLTNKTGSEKAKLIQQPLNLFSFSQPFNTSSVNLLENDISNIHNQPYLIFYLSTLQAAISQNISLSVRFIDYEYTISFNFTINSVCDEGMESYQFQNKQLCKYCGYWREFLTAASDNIPLCNIQPKNCIGGNQTGNYLCKEGTIGPLCAICDIKSSFWSENYGTSINYSCIKCSDIQNNNVKIILAAILFQLISVILIYSQYKSTLNILYANYLSKMGIIYIGRSLEKTRSTTPITKILLFGLSIYDITSFASESSVLNNLSLLFGYPVSSSFVSTDCYLSSILPADVSIGFVKLIFSVVFPAFSLLNVFILLIAYRLAKKITWQRLLDYCIMSFGYIFLFSSYSTILEFSLQSLTCLQLYNKSYLKIDLNYECNSDLSQIKSLKAFAIFFLIFICIIFPIAFFYYVYYTRNQHSRIRVKLKVGFVFQEYKNKYYYWEIIRQVVKILMVAIHLSKVQQARNSVGNTLLISYPIFAHVLVQGLKLNRFLQFVLY